MTTAGGCLDQLLHDFGRFGESVICNYTKQINRGIVFLHEKDIIHRDLKGEGVWHELRVRRQERYGMVKGKLVVLVKESWWLVEFR